MAVLVFPDFDRCGRACTQRSSDHGRSQKKLLEWWLEAGVPLAMDRIG
ncbi:MAG TPA: hypothetical protein VJ862_10925 [Rhodanobacteraceae bacterium]|nr:hypothetical protein [Rhodanobacteraceae bacterium]